MEEIKRHRQSDCIDLANFMNKFFPQKQNGIIIRSRSADYYRWKYDNNPFGNSIVYHYWKDNELIGTSAAIPFQLSVRGEIVLTYEQCDDFTAPPYQGKGIHRRLADIVFSEIDRNSSISYGTGATEVNLGILIKRYNAYKVLMYRRIVNVLNVADILRAKNNHALAKIGGCVDLLNQMIFPVPKIEVQETSQAEPDCCHVPDATIDFSIVRSFEYLKYRYIECPEPYRFFIVKYDSQPRMFVVKIVDWRGIRMCYLIDVLPAYDSRRTDAVLLGALRQIGIQTLSAAVLVDLPFPFGLGRTMKYGIKGFLFKGQKEVLDVRQSRWPFLNPTSSDYNKESWIYFAGNGDDL